MHRYIQVFISEKTKKKFMSFPGSSAGEESACNAGDPGLIPRLRRSPGEEIGHIPVLLGFPGG